MLALTKRTEYALIALHYMIEQGAISDDGSPGKLTPVSAREIAERYGVPLPLLMNILKKLAAEHVLLSVRGAKGGYVLSRNPRHMSLSQMIEAVEGPVQMVECACEDAAEADATAADEELIATFKCKLSHSCPIKRPLQILHAKLTEFLKDTSVYDVCSYKDEWPMPKLRKAVVAS